VVGCCRLPEPLGAQCGTAPVLPVRRLYNPPPLPAAGVALENVPAPPELWPGYEGFAIAGGGAGRVWGDQSGRTSAPIIPHLVQTIRGHNDRTGVSSGSQSAFMVAL
jgi:hypothetical protein